MDRLMDRLGAGELVVIDGATGTECERRGVPKLDGAWNGGAALSHPDVVRQIHRDYLEAGAELIIANTFATHRHALELAGVADDFVAYNRRGVELAVQARAEVAADTPSSPPESATGRGKASIPRSMSSFGTRQIRPQHLRRVAPSC